MNDDELITELGYILQRGVAPEVESVILALQGLIECGKIFEMMNHLVPFLIDVRDELLAQS